MSMFPGGIWPPSCSLSVRKVPGGRKTFMKVILGEQISRSRSESPRLMLSGGRRDLTLVELLRWCVSG